MSLIGDPTSSPDKILYRHRPEMEAPHILRHERDVDKATKIQASIRGALASQPERLKTLRHQKQQVGALLTTTTNERDTLRLSLAGRRGLEHLAGARSVRLPRDRLTRAKTRQRRLHYTAGQKQQPRGNAPHLNIKEPSLRCQGSRPGTESAPRGRSRRR